MTRCADMRRIKDNNATKREGMHMKPIVKVNDNNCKINFSGMKHFHKSLSTQESLRDVKPFEISDDVKNGSNKIIVDDLLQEAADIQKYGEPQWRRTVDTST